ncbi:hypothetical protein Tco_0514351 [Tanacetum coccineum]
MSNLGLWVRRVPDSIINDAKTTSCYKADEALLDSYGNTVTIKRRRDNADDDQEPSDGPDRGSKRRRAGKEPESSSAPRKKTSTTTGKSTKGSQSHQRSAGRSALAEATTKQLDWTKPEGQRYPHDLQKPLPLIPNSRGRQVIPFSHFINNDLAYLSGGVSSRTYSTSVTKTKAADYGNIKWIEDLVPSLIWSKVPIVEWHGYKHLDWITVRRDVEKLYSFKEGDFKRLRLQDIEDMLIQLFKQAYNQGWKNPSAFSVALRMFTRSIVIQRLVKDLQLGVKSYQTKLNITKPDTYKPDLRRQGT